MLQHHLVRRAGPNRYRGMNDKNKKKKNEQRFWGYLTVKAEQDDTGIAVIDIPTHTLCEEQASELAVFMA